MKIEKLTLENFRGFEKLEMAFEPDLTVLVGGNGSGKTSILDAIVWSILGVRPEGHPHPLPSLFDYRSGSTEMSLHLITGSRRRRERAQSWSARSLEAALPDLRRRKTPLDFQPLVEGWLERQLRSRG